MKPNGRTQSRDVSRRATARSHGGALLSATAVHATALSIGELAARAGVTAETIRYYEREGVIPEAERGGAGRYRQYRAADVERLRFIRRARDLGFSLDEVGELLALADGSPSRDCSSVNRIARTHLAQVDEKLAQLSALRTELDRVIGECDGVVPVGECRILAALSDGVDQPAG